MDGAGDSSDAGGDPDAWAHVLEVTVTGEPQAYTFSVKIHSSDTGCEHYCDWWEVLTVEGELLYRRTLLHAHLADGASGNPFERTGGPVPVGPDQELIVRGHTNVGGYEGVDLRGSISGGFVEAPDLGPDFASALEDAEPQPPACDPNQT
jgi:hypothetical protein